MELKEIVNLRKVREYYDDSLTEELCEFCPCRTVCNEQEFKSKFNPCLLERILGIEYDNRDLYDLERDGELTPDYQIPVNEDCL